MKAWPQATLWLLTQTYAGHCGAPLVDCPAILASHAEMRKEGDMLMVFIERHFASAPEFLLDLDVAMEQYDDYCALENIKHSRPHAVRRRLRECFGEPRHGDGDKVYFKATLKISVSQFAMGRVRQTRM